MWNGVGLDPEDFGEEAAKEFQKELEQMKSVHKLTLEDDGFDEKEIDTKMKLDLKEANNNIKSKEDKIKRLRQVANPNFWED